MPASRSADTVRIIRTQIGAHMTLAGSEFPRPDVHLHIGTEKLAEGSAGTFSHVNPATGKVDKTIPMAGPSEVDRAVTASADTFDSWKRTAPTERARLLHRLADLMEANAEELGRLGA